MRYIDDQYHLSATDLSNHLGCRHLTQLTRQAALGEIKKPYWHDPALDVLIKRGNDHEAAYVEYLRSKGLRVTELRNQPVPAVVQAMQEGVDVITQATFENGSWTGIADILIKVEGQSNFGDWSYEVQDTKLSQNTRAATILQLCLYSELLSIVQGSEPDKMHVIKPSADFTPEEYRYADFKAYYRLSRKNFEDIMKGPAPETYPEPVEHCSICRWWRTCYEKRKTDDHLSLVAGIRSLHIVELQQQNINTLEQFARTEKLEKPARGNRETFIRKQAQAAVQFRGRTEGLTYDLLDAEVGRGLNRLPEPNEGDIYFDIEGDPFYEGGGLEYVLGYAFRENGNLKYKRSWSTGKTEEKKSFHEFMQFVTERWKRYPNMHIYHFAPYEQAAVKRLAHVHTIFERELDELLRAERFIDLHAAFKESVLASVEVYSLKELEKFTTYTRKVELHDASVARKTVEIALELHDFKSLPRETIQALEGYNEDDCLATESLHQWLENLRTRLIKSGREFQRPVLKTGEASENIQKNDTWALQLYKDLTEKLPENKADWSDEDHARWLLAHQIEYFRREDKSAWWEFYRVHELEHEELLDERKALTGLRFVQELPKEKRERNVTHRYSYPPQETSIDEGDDLIEVKGEKIGSVKGISLENGTIDIKKTEKMAGHHPQAVHVSERVDPGSLATSLMNFAGDVIEYGLGHTWPYHASKDLLMKRKPKLVDGSEGAYLLPGEDAVEGAIRIALNLDRSVLAIQGPPGSGKTYTGASMIIALLKAGKKIGITAISHKVIQNLAKATIALAAAQNVKVQFVHKNSNTTEDLPVEITEVPKSDKVIDALNEGKVGCGTAWLWAEDNSRETLDYLFVDEAGQMSLSQVLAASRAARNLILLGDPQQLEQPQRGAHPEGSDIAALAYLLDGHATMPEGKGLFLGITRRLHPAICAFTSELFYEGLLKSLPGLEKQCIGGNTRFDGAGLFYVPVTHKGNQSSAPEEVQEVCGIVDNLLATGTCTNAKGETHSLQKNDILIVAPFNAQVSALRRKLPDMRIGTVDKFQGQEAPVVIYSMTSSTPEDAPRGMSFLYNLNRLNVATSRARCICILVASPPLLEPACHTIDQMKWANALCRYAELVS